MTALPFGVGTYRRKGLPDVRLVNFFAESTPVAGEPVVLVGRPALVRKYTLGNGPVHGIFAQAGVYSGDLFTVSGCGVYRNAALIGNISTSSRVVIAEAFGQLLIATGTGFYSTDGATVSPVTFPFSDGVTWVGYKDGVAFAVRTGTRNIYYSFDGTWNAGDVVSTERSTGVIVGAAIVGDYIWVFCEQTTEIFVTTGDSEAALQKVEGRVFDKGCASRDTIVKADNSVFWVGDDKIAYRGADSPLRISDHGIEELLEASNDLRAWNLVRGGHSFYVLSTETATVAFDAATNEWCEFDSYDRPRWRAHLGVSVESKTYAGDDETGTVWTLSDDVQTDEGVEVVGLFTANLDNEVEGFCDVMDVVCANGFGDDAVIEMRYSDDSAKTWRPWRPASLGAQGRFRSRARWKRLGVMDGRRVFQFRVSSAVARLIKGVRMNEPGASRGR